MEFLSTRHGGETAIFITEDDAQGGRDHIDSHRTVLLGGAVLQEELCIACELQLPGHAEDRFGCCIFLR